MCAIRSLNILKEAIQVFLKQFYQSKHYLSKKMCMRESVLVVWVSIFISISSLKQKFPKQYLPFYMYFNVVFSVLLFLIL